MSPVVVTATLFTATMSDEAHIEEHEDHHEDEADAGYAPPPEKSLDELMALDTEDESLRKYKATLLGQATGDAVIVGGYRGVVLG